MEKINEYTQVDLIGPGCWTIIHMLTHSVSHEHTSRKYAHDMVFHIRKHFPCLECREHFISMTDKNPIGKVTTGMLFEKYFQLHTKVNSRLGKETPLFKYVKEFYSGNYFSEHEDLNKLISL